MQVVLVEIQHLAHQLDFRIRIERQPAGFRQRVHLPDQVLHQLGRRLRAGPGIGPRQIVDRRRIEPIRKRRHTHRSRRLVQEPRPDAAAAFLVLQRLADQGLEQFQGVVPVAVMHAQRITDQHRGDAHRPEQGNPVRLRHIASGGKPVRIAHLVQTGLDQFRWPHGGAFPLETIGAANPRRGAISHDGPTA